MENRSITAVPGVQAGHWTHASGTTGVTAVLFPNGAIGGVAVPGSASGSRELGALEARHVAGRVHGFCLAGGSAFGLGAADGVMAALEARGIGFDTGFGRVPIVPACILFDLHTGQVRPGADAGRAAAEAASAAPLEEGRVGAAAGARIGAGTDAPAPGGTGTWAMEVDGRTVGAVAAVNALGAVFDAGRRVAGGELAGGLPERVGEWRGQTTLVAVATDAPLSRGGCDVLARMASAGMARAIVPAFTPFDGDVVLAASTGAGDPVDAVALARIGHAAALCVERAIIRGAGAR